MTLNKSKTNPQLGKEVAEYIESKGVQTPMEETERSLQSDESKIKEIKHHYKEIMLTLGLDLTDDSLQETPIRIGKMYINDLFWGLKSENFPKCTAVENKMKSDQMVLVKNIKVQSLCEHHALPFISDENTGCHIAYIPKDKILGLSKFNRIVEYFSRRPQIQERLTDQIFYALEYILGTSDIAVVIGDCQHLCVKLRGIEDQNSKTTTSKMGGRFMTVQSLRQEFISMIK